MIANLVLVAALAAGEWPFAILRSYGSYGNNRVFTERAFAAQERHPGLIEEIWFGGCDGFQPPEECARQVEETVLPVKARCEQLGIAFSYQQGCTLNHGPDDEEHPGYPDDCWVVDSDGKRRTGLFCCTSPFAKEHSKNVAKAILAKLQPVSYWPDDDLRLFKMDWSRPCICFCDRCLKMFNARTGNSFDRVSLLRELNGGSAEVRRAWCAFNGEVLGEYARVYREAVDEASPKTRLGIQIALSGNCYDGESWKTVLKAFAGKDGQAGIRPGGLYYTDQNPREMIEKTLMVAREAARSSRLPETAQICYETENWPHIGAHKSPGGMMAECALALASGCDSLALYWGADQDGESEESYDFWFDTVAKWKPFLLSVRDAFRGTWLGGVACYHGEGHAATKEWINHEEPAVAKIAGNAVPMTVTEAEPDCWYLSELGVRTLTTNDLSRVFGKAVIMDLERFRELARRFPELKFTQKIAVESFDGERALATAKRANGYERFRALGQCENVKAKLRAKADDVVALSEMTVDPTTCGTCVIPTEFGGKVVVVQEFPLSWYHRAWPGCRRHAALDALDLAVPGGMPARLLTDGYACSVSVRKMTEGRTAGVFVMNLGTGKTPPMELAIRRGAAKSWALARPGQADVAAETVRTEGDETIVRLPALSPFGVVLVKAAELPRPEYPRPQFERAAWINLNGPWTYTFDFGQSGIQDGRELYNSKGFDKTIVVPFCPESKLSGVGYTDFIPAMWYHRKLAIPAEWKGKRVFLNFGGVDYESEIYVDGFPVGLHYGGSASFSVDLTQYVTAGKTHELVVRVKDANGAGQPSGKQSTNFKSAGCHYTRTTGIWQTVWLEAVDPAGLRSCRIVPDLDGGAFVFTPAFVSDRARKLRITVKTSDGQPAGAAEAKAVDGIAVVVPLKVLKTWSPEDPHLYDVVYETLDAEGRVTDTVRAYAGLRKVSVEDGRILLNNKPRYLRLVLDQGFYPDGIWTAPSDAALKRDIELSMAAGFNGARLHQKVFEERFHYWADRLGYLTWGEMSSWGSDPTDITAARNFIPEWCEVVRRDLNHPSIIAWTPYNETWNWNDINQHQRTQNDVYELTKAIDPTRPVNSSSGDIHAKTDLWTIHSYDRAPKLGEIDVPEGQAWAQGWMAKDPRWARFPYHRYDGQPYLIDEFGGLGWVPPERRAADNTWGYGSDIKTEDEFFSILKDEVDQILGVKRICGYCYTQLTDVEQEQNGVYYYDRTPKFDVKKFKDIFGLQP